MGTFIFLRSRDIVNTYPVKAVINVSSNFRAFSGGIISITIIHKAATMCEENKTYFNNPGILAAKSISLSVFHIVLNSFLKFPLP